MGNQIINRMLKLKTRPMMGEVSSDNFELVEEEVRDIEDGDILFIPEKSDINTIDRIKDIVNIFYQVLISTLTIYTLSGSGS